jgi:ABC-type transporter Mla subunit MlaD
MLDLNVGYALQRAKRTIDQIRQNSPDTLRIQSALGQVSEWLHSAAETSDRALRSLEDERLQTKKSQIGVFTKDDLDG